MSRVKPLFTYTVESSKLGEFPTDMLRRDSSRPATDADAALIEALNFGNPAKDKLPERVSVTLLSESRFAPMVERWESFGWRVTQSDNPYITPSLDPALDRDALRRKEIGKLRVAVLKANASMPFGTEFGGVREALSEAFEVATRDAEWRREALGFCKGVNRMLVRTGAGPYMPAYAEALTCAQLLLGADTLGMVQGMQAQTALAVAALGNAS